MERKRKFPLRRFFNISRSLWKLHGITFPWVILSRFFVFFYCVLFRRHQVFSYGGKLHRYAFHLMNATFRCERTIEIPIALETYPLTGRILEVGNVLNQYFRFPHDVVDKYEVAPGVMNEDIISYAPSNLYNLILSISTLEHVGWDEDPKDPPKLARALDHLKSLLRPGGVLLATVPLGYNTFLDQCVRNETLGLTKIDYYIRTSKSNQWEAGEKNDALSRTYGSRFPCANAIAVLAFQKPLNG